MTAAFHFISGSFQCSDKCLEVLWLSGQNGVYIAADDTADGFPLRVDRPFLPLGIRRRRYYGEPVLQTDEIADLLKGKTGTPEIPELLLPSIAVELNTI